MNVRTDVCTAVLRGLRGSWRTFRRVAGAPAAAARRRWSRDAGRNLDVGNSGLPLNPVNSARVLVLRCRPGSGRGVGLRNAVQRTQPDMAIHPRALSGPHGGDACLAMRLMECLPSSATKKTLAWTFRTLKLRDCRAGFRAKRGRLRASCEDRDKHLFFVRSEPLGSDRLNGGAKETDGPCSTKLRSTGLK